MNRSKRSGSPSPETFDRRRDDAGSPTLLQGSVFNQSTDFLLSGQFESGNASNIKLLREYYSTAKSLAAELSNSSNVALAMRVHSQQASRVYSALSTLLYSSISIAKADELERYIRKKAAQLPRSLIDIEQWVYVLQVAKDCREGPENRAIVKELEAVKQDSKALLYTTALATREASNDWRKLKFEVETELVDFQLYFTDIKTQLARASVIKPAGKATKSQIVGKTPKERDSVGRPKSALPSVGSTGGNPSLLSVSRSTNDLSKKDSGKSRQTGPRKHAFVDETTEALHQSVDTELWNDVRSLMSLHDTEIDRLKRDHAREIAAISLERDTALSDLATEKDKLVQALAASSVSALTLAPVTDLTDDVSIVFPNLIESGVPLGTHATFLDADLENSMDVSAMSDIGNSPQKYALANVVPESQLAEEREAHYLEISALQDKLSSLESMVDQLKGPKDLQGAVDFTAKKYADAVAAFRQSLTLEVLPSSFAKDSTDLIIAPSQDENSKKVADLEAQLRSSLASSTALTASAVAEAEAAAILKADAMKREYEASIECIRSTNVLEMDLLRTLHAKELLERSAYSDRQHREAISSLNAQHSRELTSLKSQAEEELRAKLRELDEQHVMQHELALQSYDSKISESNVRHQNSISELRKLLMATHREALLEKDEEIAKLIADLKAIHDARIEELGVIDNLMLQQESTHDALSLSHKRESELLSTIDSLRNDINQLNSNLANSSISEPVISNYIGHSASIVSNVTSGAILSGAVKAAAIQSMLKSQVGHEKELSSRLNELHGRHHEEMEALRIELSRRIEEVTKSAAENSRNSISANSNIQPTSSVAHLVAQASMAALLESGTRSVALFSSKYPENQAEALAPQPTGVSGEDLTRILSEKQAEFELERNQIIANLQDDNSAQITSLLAKQKMELDEERGQLLATLEAANSERIASLLAQQKAIFDEDLQQRLAALDCANSDRIKHEQSRFATEMSNTIEALKRENSEKILSLQRNYQVELEEMQTRIASTGLTLSKDMQARHAQQMLEFQQSLTAQHAVAIAKLEDRHTNELEEYKLKTSQEIQDLKASHRAELENWQKMRTEDESKTISELVAQQANEIQEIKIVLESFHAEKIYALQAAYQLDIETMQARIYSDNNERLLALKSQYQNDFQPPRQQAVNNGIQMEDTKEPVEPSVDHEILVEKLSALDAELVANLAAAKISEKQYLDVVADNKSLVERIAMLDAAAQASRMACAKFEKQYLDVVADNKSLEERIAMLDAAAQASRMACEKFDKQCFELVVVNTRLQEKIVELEANRMACEMIEKLNHERFAGNHSLSEELTIRKDDLIHQAEDQKKFTEEINSLSSTIAKLKASLAVEVEKCSIIQLRANEAEMLAKSVLSERELYYEEKILELRNRIDELEALPPDNNLNQESVPEGLDYLKVEDIVTNSVEELQQISPSFVERVVSVPDLGDLQVGICEDSLFVEELGSVTHFESSVEESQRRAKTLLSKLKNLSSNEYQGQLSVEDVALLQTSQFKDIESLQKELQSKWAQLKTQWLDEKSAIDNLFVVIRDNGPTGSNVVDGNVVEMVGQLKALTSAVASQHLFDDDLLINNGKVDEEFSVDIAEDSRISESEASIFAERAKKLLFQLQQVTGGGVISDRSGLELGGYSSVWAEESDLRTSSIFAEPLEQEVARAQNRFDAIFASKIERLFEKHLTELDSLRSVNSKISFQLVQEIQRQHAMEISTLKREFELKFRDVVSLWKLVKESYECELELAKHSNAASASAIETVKPADVQADFAAVAARALSTKLVGSALFEATTMRSTSASVAGTAKGLSTKYIETALDNAINSQSLQSGKDSSKVSKFRDNESMYLKQIEKQLVDYASLTEQFEIERKETAAKLDLIAKLENKASVAEGELSIIQTQLKDTKMELSRAINASLDAKNLVSQRDREYKLLLDELKAEKSTVETYQARVQEFEKMLEETSSGNHKLEPPVVESSSEAISKLKEKYEEEYQRQKEALQADKDRVTAELTATIDELRASLRQQNYSPTRDVSLIDDSQDNSVSDIRIRADDASIESGGSALRRITDEFKELQKNEEFRNKCALKLQAHSRGFLTRARIKREHLQRLALAQGVLVAYTGTKQGKTGWYTSGDSFFYFCMDKGEFVLLCGPITKDVYDVAVQELRLSLSTFPPAGRFPLNLELDRLGLHATRVQIETLTEDLRDAEDRLATSQQAFESYRQRVLVDFENLQDRVETELQAQLQKQADAFEVKLKLLNENLRLTESENIKLKNRLQNRTPVMFNPQKINEKASDESVTKVVVKLQSKIRAFVARKQFLRTKTFIAAKQSGVLIALPGTFQGDSGWYIEPNGGIFYFVLVKGEWIPVVGPLSREEYESNRKQIPESVRSHIGANVLCKCSYQLSFRHESFNGDLYLSNQTGRLFVVSAVEQVLVSSSLYGGDLMSSSLGSDKFDEYSM